MNTGAGNHGWQNPTGALNTLATVQHGNALLQNPNTQNPNTNPSASAQSSRIRYIQATKTSTMFSLDHKTQYGNLFRRLQQGKSTSGLSLDLTAAPTANGRNPIFSVPVSGQQVDDPITSQTQEKFNTTLYTIVDRTMQEHFPDLKTMSLDSIRDILFEGDIASSSWLGWAYSSPGHTPISMTWATIVQQYQTALRVELQKAGERIPGPASPLSSMRNISYTMSNGQSVLLSVPGYEKDAADKPAMLNIMSDCVYTCSERVLSLFREEDIIEYATKSNAPPPYDVITPHFIARILAAMSAVLMNRGLLASSFSTFKQNIPDPSLADDLTHAIIDLGAQFRSQLMNAAVLPADDIHFPFETFIFLTRKRFLTSMHNLSIRKHGAPSPTNISPIPRSLHPNSGAQTHIQILRGTSGGNI